ncbi:MAG: DUF1015 family protein [Pseudomonadota bacterium]|nr:DUF1015 family protein [Pseudomonadota bacterium]
MPLIKPFRALRPIPAHAPNVAAPPYDVLNTNEARQKAKDKPWSFLHISKPEIDLPEDTNPYAPEVYAKGLENLKNQIDNGILLRETKSCFYVYQLQMGRHIQTGLVFLGSVAEYEKNRIRKHEFTRPGKEDDRVRQITALNAQTGPVLLTYRSKNKINSILSETIEQPPLYDLYTDNNIGHKLWVINNKEKITKLTELFESLDTLYIADGHHRSASAARVAKAKNSKLGKISGSNSWDYFLCVAFPDSETQIFDYNRVVKDLNGLSKELLLKKIREKFAVTIAGKQAKPIKPQQFGMFLDGEWYFLEINPDLVSEKEPVSSLDVAILQNHLLGPILSIDNPRTEPRIDFVGGIRGLEELEKRVNSGEMAIAFALFPTSIKALMKVADANEVMPPKSTWFEPKLADGLVSHVLD